MNMIEIMTHKKKSNVKCTMIASSKYDAAQKRAKRRCTSEHDRDHETQKSNVTCTMTASNEGKFVTNITHTHAHTDTT